MSRIISADAATKPNTSGAIRTPASLRSDGVRLQPGTLFAFPSETAVRLRRNPHTTQRPARSTAPAWDLRHNGLAEAGQRFLIAVAPGVASLQARATGMVGLPAIPILAPPQSKRPQVSLGPFVIIGRRPTLPPTCAGSTIGAEGLNFRVRDGNGCDPLATVTQNPYRKCPGRNRLRAAPLPLCGRQLILIADA